MKPKNQIANDAYIQCNYPNEKFISDTAELQSPNKYAKGRRIPENVKVAESRIPN
jgi:hypothetical protein